MFGNSKLKALMLAGAMAGAGMTKVGISGFKRGGAVILGPIGKLPDTAWRKSKGAASQRARGNRRKAKRQARAR